MKTIFLIVLLCTMNLLSQTYLNLTQTDTELQNILNKVDSLVDRTSDETISGIKTVDNQLRVVRGDSILVDNSSNTGQDSPFNQTYIAFKYTPSTTIRPRALRLNLKRTGTITNPEGWIEGWFYSDNAGTVGTKISTVQEREYFGRLDTVYQAYAFQCGHPILTGGTSYWVVLKYNTAPVGGTISVQSANSGTNNYAYSLNGTSWTLTGSAEVDMILYYDEIAGLYVNTQHYYGAEFYSNTEYGLFASSIFDAGIVSQSVTGQGLYATSTYGSGLYAISTYGSGVTAMSGTKYPALLAYSTGNYGVYSSIENTNYAAILGQNTTGEGIYGISTSYYGIHGVSTSSFGVYGSTATSVGVKGYGSSSGIGVYGNSVSGFGVQAISTNSTALYAVSYNQPTMWAYRYSPDSTTNLQVLKIGRGSSGTMSVGAGEYIGFYLDNASESEKLTGFIASIFTNATAGSEGGALTFATRQSSGTVSEKMRIDSTGNIGIGTISADTKLVVNGAYNYYADTSGTNGNVNALGINTDDFSTSELIDGTELTIKCNSINTGAVTLYINAGTSGAIVKTAFTGLAAGDLIQGWRIKVSYDATNNRFQLLSPIAQ